MDERVVWALREYDIAEGIGEVIYIGIAKVVDIVQRRMAKECRLATPLWLKGDSRNEIYC
jgi:hypothetical protein